MPAVPFIALAVAAVGTGYSIYSSMEAAGDAKDAADKQAAAELLAAEEEATRIREKGTRFKAEQRAALAGSGAGMDSSSATALLADTTYLTERDALAVLKGGARRSQTLLDQGDLLSSRYQSQAIASGLSGVGSMLSMGTSYLNSQQPATTANLIRTGTITSGTTGNTYSNLSLLSGGLSTKP